MHATGRHNAASVRPEGLALRAGDDLDYLVRALSHDLNAQFMLLENSFSHLAKAADDPARPEVRELVSHVRACLDQSRWLLRDLVGLARTGRMDMEPQRVELADVIDEVLFEHRQLLAERGIRMEIRCLMPAVWCNRHRLKQIVGNLLQNAIKHGCDPDRPRITVSSAIGKTRKPDRQFVILRVHDNGPGIPRQFHEEIFLPGRRLPAATAEGSGMGLAIVRRIAEHYGGSVSVDPDCPGGMAFLVQLPLPPDETTASMPPSADEDCGGQRRVSLGHDAPHKAQGRRPHRKHQSRRLRDRT